MFLRRMRKKQREALCATAEPSDGRSACFLQTGRLLCLQLSLLILLVPGAGPRLHAQRWHASTGAPKPQKPQPLDDMSHLNWTRRDGAPSDVVALAQTKDGYLWIGSSFGLFRFDGISFQAYPFTAADPHLPASNIAALAADKDGGLWIGYRMGGISYLHNGDIKSYARKDGLVGQSTEQLVCRDDGSVWGIADGVMVHLSGDKWETYSVEHGLNSQGLFSLFFDRDGNLWTADKGHVFELKTGESTFSEQVDIPKGVVNQFAQLPDGNIWISDAWKNARPLHDDAGTHAVKIPGVPVMLADSEGNVWLANEFGGITRITNPGAAEPARRRLQARKRAHRRPNPGDYPGPTRDDLGRHGARARSLSDHPAGPVPRVYRSTTTRPC